MSEGFFMCNDSDKVFITSHAMNRFMSRCKPSYVNLSCISKKNMQIAKVDLFNKAVDALNKGLPIKNNGNCLIIHKGIEYLFSFPSDYANLITIMNQNDNTSDKYMKTQFKNDQIIKKYKCKRKKQNENK